ncbi:MAG TPA: TIR domain-containing protein [Caulobacteraceae bacterium]|nr:TIR domain-containing protein [Caulobacteraceae bacterium]
MSDVFISYARSTAAQAQQVGDALRALGYGVWRDDELPPHRAYADVIEERLAAAKAVVVLWSAEAVRSEWVQSEADRARADRKLVQLNLDGARLPMPFDRIQCADLAGWDGNLQSPAWRKVIESIAALAAAPAPAGSARAARSRPAPKLSICVLPFANMSDDPQQEYFSDGVSEDIITDLSKVSALSVVARNTAFTFKGKAVRVGDVARELNVSHVLEGSVRKAGNRVRITAQLIDGAAGDHLWAERWDRDLTDIFALQDEISQAIVAALKLKLMPEEKEAIARRGTENAEAYTLYLMARQYLVNGNLGNPRHQEAIVRLCEEATAIDPAYARAWALMARGQRSLRFTHSRPGDDGLAAAERALQLDPNLAEAHAVKARYLEARGRPEAANAEIELALGLDPEGYEANDTAGDLSFRQERFEDAARYYEQAASLMEAEVGCAAMLVTCYSALGDEANMRRVAKMTIDRAEQAMARDPSNGSAMAWAVSALAALGDGERAREWSRRAVIVDPDNSLMRYNLACALCRHLSDIDGALELLGPFLATASQSYVSHAMVDPDMDPVREDPRFKAMLAAAEARVAADSSAASA